MSTHQGIRPLRRPAPLKAGDRVALISPSSHQGRYPPEYVQDARAVLEGWGLRVVDEPMAEKHLYLAGTDAERAQQFERHYTDPDMKALFCTRGGYGASRMLPLLHQTAIAAATPKWVVGFSDVTSLFAYLRAQAGVSVLHGPCLAAPSAITSPRKGENVNALREALFDPESRPRYSGKWLHPAANGSAPIVGRLVGGCLSVVVTALGTPWQVDMRDAILFLEDTGEAPYRIDRMITHLRTAGMFTHLRGIAFGHLQKCDGDPPGLLHDVLLDLFRDAPFPVVTGIPCGHGDLNLPLELGAEYELVADGEAASLRKR